MYPSLLLLLTTSFLLHHLTSAIPAGPLARPVPGALLVNAQDLTPEDRANLTKWTIEVNGRNYAVSRPSALGGRRPRSGVMWPEGSAGKYFLDFHDFKTDIQWSRGQAVLTKATDDVDGWITSVSKHSYTPVEKEHHWRLDAVEFKIKPSKPGSILLGDLKAYIALIATFHARYGEYWEWEAQLLSKGGWGSVSPVGTAKLWKY
ncbi:MAG: hypothetical protein LQ344_004133 [Seirophora lacunosa]|nr:MAG: hypothetical protein LQ344_004133 [Seirophora lacunosa]